MVDYHLGVHDRIQRNCQVLDPYQRTFQSVVVRGLEKKRGSPRTPAEVHQLLRVILSGLVGKIFLKFRLGRARCVAALFGRLPRRLPQRQGRPSCPTSSPHQHWQRLLCRDLAVCRVNHPALPLTHFQFMPLFLFVLLLYFCVPSCPRPLPSFCFSVSLGDCLPRVAPPFPSFFLLCIVFHTISKNVLVFWEIKKIATNFVCISQGVKVSCSSVRRLIGRLVLPLVDLHLYSSFCRNATQACCPEVADAAAREDATFGGVEPARRDPARTRYEGAGPWRLNCWRRSCSPRYQNVLFRAI